MDSIRFLNTWDGAAIPIDNNVDADAAYLAFMMATVLSGGQHVTRAEFLSAYWSKLLPDYEEFA
jgi:hypothetical protein